MQDITASQTREDYNKVEGTQFLSWVSLLCSLLLLVNVPETSVDVRVILQAALLTNSVAIILAHNHPSGNLKPSRQDMEITKQVKDAARLMRITVLDHLILTDAGYYSFADEGEL